MKKYIFIYCIILLFLFSCTSDLYDEMATNDKVPDKETRPVVESFKVSDKLIINWEEDVGAEEYILYRDMLPDGGFSEVVYRGNDLKYTDNEVQRENFYYYKLAKKRGKKTFDKSKYSFGFASDYIKDEHEDNNTSETATNINDTISLDANIYYCRDGHGNELIDDDWYCLNVNAKTRCVFQITFKKIGTNDYNFILKVLVNNSISELSDTSTFNVENHSDKSEKYYFKIEVNKNPFLAAVADAGNRIEAYVLHLLRTEPIVPQ